MLKSAPPQQNALITSDLGDFCETRVSGQATRLAFTLAEVLITLGIIGVVAAITMPVITANVQKVVLRNQLKKIYTNFSNGIEQVKSNLHQDINCYYWDNNPYTSSGNSAICTSTNEYGTCKSWSMGDGSSVPADYNGHMSECRNFDNELFGKVFQVAKFCERNALANGCISNAYKGADKVKSIANPDVEQDPGQIFSDSNIKNSYPVWILNDGTIIIRYYAVGSSPIYTVDVNGHKGPNKWGYDIFTFELVGNTTDGIKRIKGINYATEKGGTASSTMLTNLFSQ